MLETTVLERALAIIPGKTCPFSAGFRGFRPPILPQTRSRLLEPHHRDRSLWVQGTVFLSVVGHETVGAEQASPTIR